MVFERIFESRLDLNRRERLSKALAAVRENLGGEGFERSFSLIPRFARGNPDLSGEEIDALRRDTSSLLDFQSWTLDEMARTDLLLAASSRLPADRFREIVNACYLHGDVREQIAVQKSLSLLPDNSRFLSLALSAFRSNAIPVFAALALGNPYPADRFDEAAFNNLVLKAVFVELPLPRILGLAERANAALAAMIEDWMDEREAASRRVTPEIWPLVCPFVRDRERMARYQESGDPAHASAISQTLAKIR